MVAIMPIMPITSALRDTGRKNNPQVSRQAWYIGIGSPGKPGLHCCGSLTQINDNKATKDKQQPTKKWKNRNPELLRSWSSITVWPGVILTVTISWLSSVPVWSMPSCSYPALFVSLEGVVSWLPLGRLNCFLNTGLGEPHVMFCQAILPPLIKPLCISRAMLSLGCWFIYH